MFNNDFNPSTVSRDKAFFEINYYGMCKDEFIVLYGDKENYKSSEVTEFLTNY